MLEDASTTLAIEINNGGPELKDGTGNCMIEHLSFGRNEQFFTPEVKPKELPPPEPEKAEVSQTSLCDHRTFKRNYSLYTNHDLFSFAYNLFFILAFAVYEIGRSSIISLRIRWRRICHIRRRKEPC
jgi:hypothetical protein